MLWRRKMRRKRKKWSEGVEQRYQDVVGGHQGRSRESSSSRNLVRKLGSQLARERMLESEIEEVVGVEAEAKREG
jgi:hypothetical protein